MLLALIHAGVTAFACFKLYEFAKQPAPQPDVAPDDITPDEAATGEPASDGPSESEAEQSLALTFTSIGLVGAGKLFHPVFTTLSYPVLLLGMLPTIRQVWAEIREQRRLNYPGLEVAQTGAELALGFPGLTASGWLIFSGGQRILLATRRGAEQGLTTALHDTAVDAWVVRDGVELQIPLEQIAVGELVVLRPGDPIPVDGRIVEGFIGVDQRALTGEARLLELGVGDRVLASTLVLSGHAIAVAERTGADTLAAGVAALLANTVSYEQRLTARVTRETERSVAPTLAIVSAGLLARGPIGVLGGLWSNGLDMAWLGAPFSMLNTLDAAAKAGIVIKDARSLELLPTIDTVVFDKTGTLTLDEFEIAEIHCRPGIEREHALALAAALEQRQTHPIAHAILEAARAAGLTIPTVEQQMLELGYGLRGLVDGAQAVLGSLRLMHLAGIAIDELGRDLSSSERSGHTSIYLALDGRLAAIFEFAPRLRPEAVEIVSRLHARGLELIILTGDDEAPTAVLAGTLGIDRHYALMLPTDKQRIITELREQGRRVCFVGDGINDSLALRHANVSVTLKGASPLALECAQVVLRNDSLLSLATLFELGDTFTKDQRVIIGTSRVATIVNATGFMLAGFGLSTIVAVYVAGLGVSLTTAMLPMLRETTRPA